MSCARIVVCLDVAAGRVVKGVRFANLRDAGDAAEVAARYAEQGVDELVLLDVAATLEQRVAALATVAAVRARLAVPLTVGGGVRSLADARALLEAGADRVAVNSAAVARPELLREIATALGAQALVVAIDAAPAPALASGYEVRVESGRRSSGRDLLEWARVAEACGAGELLVTAHHQDGTRGGYDLALLAALARAVDLPIVASGGAAHPRDLAAALRAGASAALAASLFHDGDWSVAAVKEWLAKAGFEVRS